MAGEQDLNGPRHERQRSGVSLSLPAADTDCAVGVRLPHEGPLLRVEQAAVRYVQARRAQREFTKNTAAGVRYALLGFARSVGTDLPVGRLRPRHVERWIATHDVSDNTLRLHYSQVRTFLAWCVQQRLVRANPCEGIRGPRMPRSLPRGLTPEQVSTVLRFAPDTRARAILTLMAQEGLRCVEVSRLQIGDLDRLDWVAHVVGKGGYERYLPLSTQTQKAVRDYLGKWPASSGPLFRSFSRPRAGLTPSHISDMVRGWMHDAGIDASAHALRHSALQHIYARCGSLEQVRQIGGHASLASVAIYQKRQLAITELREAMEGREY